MVEQNHVDQDRGIRERIALGRGGRRQQARAEEEKRAQKCIAAQKEYGPEQRRLMEKLQGTSDELNAAGCAGGGCSKSKAKRCKRIANRMRGYCREYNAVSQKIGAECQRPPSQMNCNQ